MVANVLGVELESLNVEVTRDVDVRGAMAIDNKVSVGVQSLQCNVRLRAKEGTNPKLLRKLREAAEHCCVVQQTLRNPPTVQTTFDMS
jgi:hypothetical protein